MDPDNEHADANGDVNMTTSQTIADSTNDLPRAMSVDAPDADAASAQRMSFFS